MKKILVILILAFSFQISVTAGTLNLSNGISVDESFNSIGITGQNSPARGAYFNQTTNNSNIITSETICSAINNCVNFNGNNNSHTGTIKNGLIRYFYNPTQAAIQVRASDVGWQYQSFGIWANSVNGSGIASAGSFGTIITPGTSIPKSGSATYIGLLGGIFSQGSSSPKLFVAADMSAGVNFASRSINFASTNSIASTSINGTYTSTPGLNMSGTLSYLGNTNSFSGTVRTSGLTVLTGTAGGQFYGPAAQEIGGVFSFRNGSIGFIGGFGGKKN